MQVACTRARVLLGGAKNEIILHKYIILVLWQNLDFDLLLMIMEYCIGDNFVCFFERERERGEKRRGGGCWQLIDWDVIDERRSFFSVSLFRCA